MGNKKIRLICVLFVMMTIMSTAFILANDYTLVCLKKGEVMKYSECNPAMPDMPCTSTLYCNYCTFIGSKGKYCPTNPNKCNALGLSCTAKTNQTTPVDTEAPQISVCTPTDESIFSSKLQYLKCNADKTVDWYYEDLTDRSPRYQKICSKTDSCLKSISFNEGENDIMVKALDLVSGKSTEKEIVFVVDSKKPTIDKVMPQKDFANGLFTIKFKESNPQSLVLHYDSKTQDVDLTTCLRDDPKTICDVNVRQAEFDVKSVLYWFELTDIADSKVLSKKYNLKVDMTPPVLLNPDSFWSQGIGRDSKYIYLNMNIDEKNFDSVKYADSTYGNVDWRSVCSTLKYGKCVKKLTFSKKGSHFVELKITDDAGNQYSTAITFTVV